MSLRVSSWCGAQLFLCIILFLGQRCLVMGRAFPRVIQALAVDNELPVDGIGFTRYGDCNDESLIESEKLIQDVFDSCFQTCSQEGGCPSSCCTVTLGGGFELFCKLPGNCIRWSRSIETGTGYMTLESYVAPATVPGLTCALDTLVVQDSLSTCAYLVDGDGFTRCEKGIDVPNNGERLSGSDHVCIRQVLDPAVAPDIADLPTSIPNVIDESTTSTTSERDSSSEDGEDPACFPGSATVTLLGGTRKRMRSLEVGDKVHVGGGVYSDVFMFTHKLEDGVDRRFVLLECSGGVSLSVSSGHFVYANGNLVEAGVVQVGDEVMSATGAPLLVLRKSIIFTSGLYNPQTLHGDIVVDDVLCSTLTSAIPFPEIAHGMLLPCRAVWKMLGIPCATFLEGENPVGDFARRIGRQLWADTLR